jgi:hypothetical protein
VRTISNLLKQTRLNNIPTTVNKNIGRKQGNLWSEYSFKNQGEIYSYIATILRDLQLTYLLHNRITAAKQVKKKTPLHFV